MYGSSSNPNVFRNAVQDSGKRYLLISEEDSETRSALFSVMLNWWTGLTK